MSKWAESPYKFASFFDPQPGLAADLVIFKMENAAGCGRAAGGRLTAGGCARSRSLIIASILRRAAGGGRLAAGGCARGRPLIIASILRLPGSEQWGGAC